MAETSPARWALLFSVLGLNSPAVRSEPPAGVVYPSFPGPASVESLDVVGDGQKIHLLLSVKPPDDANSQLVYLVSPDQGASWSKPTLLNRPGGAPVISKRGNDVQLAVNGRHIAAVWQQQGELPGSGPLAVAYSLDGGRHWIRGNNPAPGDLPKNQSYMDIAADRQGRLHLVWLDDREEHGNTQGLRYTRSDDHGRHWRQETTIDGAVCTCCWTRLTVLPDQTVSVLYRDHSPHDMSLVQHPPGTGAWQRTGTVGAFDWQFTGCPHCGGGLTGSSQAKRQRLYSVVWTGKENAAGLYFLASPDRGRNWSEPMRLADGHSREADIAASRANLAVVFSHETPGGRAIEFKISGDEGRTWSAARTLSAPDAEADHPRMVATRSGLRAFWTETRAEGGKVWAMKALD